MTYRGYKIEGDGTFGYFNVKPVGGKGNVPQSLRGIFTKPKEAEKAIDRQLNSKLSKNKTAKVVAEG